MSFELVCGQCGAVTGPSVGVCPFCKSVLSKPGESAKDPAYASIQQYFQEGKIEDALTMASLAETQDPNAMKDADFLVLFARILIESEAPTTKIRAVLAKAILLKPDNQDARDYLELAEAKSRFSRQIHDEGEKGMRALLKRRPDMDLALFLLGAHLFWTLSETQESIRLLEQCVRIRPQFLRAWGCLGSIYQKLGNVPLAAKAYQNCVRLESEPKMKSFFEDQLARVSAKR